MNKIKLILVVLITVAISNFVTANEGLWWLVMQAKDGLTTSDKWADIENVLVADPKIDMDWRPNALKPSAREVIEFFHPDFFDRIFVNLVQSQDWANLTRWLEVHPNVKLDTETRELLAKNNPDFLERFFSQIPTSAGMETFEMGKDLGDGLFGVVKHATHRNTGIHVAIKTLARRKYLELGLKYPPNEVEIMRGLKHPNLVCLLHTITTQEVIHLVMELVRGGDLFTLIHAKDHLEEPECKRIMRQILRGLQYLHGLGTAHRDLKLENILLDENGDVKLADFGFAKIASKDAVLQTMCGSPDYAAPELFLRQAYVGPEVDLWAAGVILFVMRTGYLAFNDQQAIINIRYGFPTDVVVSDALKALLALIFQPRDARCALADMMNHDWMGDWRWTPENHRLFPFQDRARVRTVLLAHRRRGTLLNRLPRDIILRHILPLAF